MNLLHICWGVNLTPRGQDPGRELPRKIVTIVEIFPRISAIVEEIIPIGGEIRKFCTIVEIGRHSHNWESPEVHFPLLDKMKYFQAFPPKRYESSNNDHEGWCYNVNRKGITLDGCPLSQLIRTARSRKLWRFSYIRIRQAEQMACQLQDTPLPFYTNFRNAKHVSVL